MQRRKLDLFFIGILIAVICLAFVSGLDGGMSALAQSPLPTHTFTPTPDSPTLTPTDTPLPEPTDTPIPTSNLPPDCTTASPSRATLWPPNHKFVAIDVLGVTDPDGDAVTITIDSIFQDERVDAPGSGYTVPDGWGVGTGSAEVRAERAGGGDGRVYHIGFTADDGNDGVCSGEVLVGVPKSKKRTAIDGGALYDSTAVIP